MKKLALLSLILFTGCSQHYDWYIDKYLVARVDNQSNYEVKMVFCSTEGPALSKVETIPAYQKDFVSKTYITTRVDKNSDHPQLYKVTEFSSNKYAALSDQDLNFVKICANSYTFVVIDKTNICSAGLKDYDQKQNPCSVSF